MIIPFENVPFLEPEEIEGFFRVHFITELDVPDKKLIGASVLYMGEGTGHAKHVHDDTTEVAYVLKGEACQSYWDESDWEHQMTMRPGDLAITSPGVVHQTMSRSTDEAPLVMYIFTARCLPKCYKVGLSQGERFDFTPRSESLLFVLDGVGRIRIRQAESPVVPYTHIECEVGEPTCVANISNGPLTFLCFTAGEERLPRQAEEMLFVDGGKVCTP